MKQATNLTLLTRDDADWFNFELNHSTFICIRFNDEAGSSGIIIPNSIIGQKKCLELLNKILKKDSKTFIETKIKVIGEKQSIELFVVLLKTNNIHFSEVILKTVECPLQILYSPTENRIKSAKKEDSNDFEEKIKVLIVDDSQTIRTLFEKILKSDPQIEVVGSIENPLKVAEFLQNNKVDVMTLDIQMPEMNGVELLQKVLPKFKVPTIMISALSLEDGPLVFSALESGAIDYIQKPSLNEVEEVSKIMIEKIKSAKNAKVNFKAVSTFLVSQQLKPKKTTSTLINNKLDQLIVIGSSTGGTEALREVLINLPSEIPPLLIVQHIPAVFSKAFADRMNQLVPFTVTEAVDGMEVLSNQVIIAAGGAQMSIYKSSGKFLIKVDENAPQMNRHKPSVDYLFQSVCDLKLDANIVGVILTGMGADGAKGLKLLRDQGAHTIGQDEATSVVYGMPQAAFQLGAVEKQLPVTSIGKGIMDFLKKSKNSFLKVK